MEKRIQFDFDLFRGPFAHHCVCAVFDVPNDDPNILLPMRGSERDSTMPPLNDSEVVPPPDIRLTMFPPGVLMGWPRGSSHRLYCAPLLPAT